MASTVTEGDYYIINGRSIGTGLTATINVYRVYNRWTGDHFYTTDYDEYYDLVTNNYWLAEGVVFQLNEDDKTTYVYRLYNPNNGYHLFTSDTTEIDTCVKAGWTNEGLAFYGNSSGVGHAPVYRLYNSYNGQHFYTANETELKACVNAGWTNEGIKFYSGGVFALALHNNGQDNWTNVELDYATQTDAQIWHVAYRPDTSVRITNRSGGKAIDVQNGAFVNGQNVQSYSSNDSAAQKWTIVPTNATLTYQGTTYQCQSVRLFNNPGGVTWVMEVSGADGDDHLAPGRNVDISSGAGYSDRVWIFVPVPDFRPGGIYSIRPVMNTAQYLDAINENNGANVYIHGCHSGSNNQYWIFTKGNGTASGGNPNYHIRNMGNKRLLTAETSNPTTTTDNVNVGLYDGTVGVSKEWSVTEYGNLVYNGKKYNAMRINYGWYPWCLDYRASPTVGAGNNATAIKNDDSIYQRWVLISETVTDPSIPTPTNLYLNSALYRKEAGDRAYQARLYPGWTCTDAWFAGNNHYEFRWHYRLCACWTSAWTGWTSWTSFVPAAIVERNTVDAWLADGINTSYDSSRYKNMEVEFQVRCVGTSVDYTTGICGPIATGKHKNIFVPSFTFSNAVMSFEGLRIGYTTDYPSGYCYLYLIKLELSTDGGSTWATETFGSMRFQNLKSTGAIYIPINYLRYNIPTGSKLRLVYQKGNDQCKRWTYTQWTAVVSVSDTGGNVEITYDVYSYIRHSAIVAIPKLDSTRLWVAQTDRAYELPEVEHPEYNISNFPKSSSKAYFLLPYGWKTNVAYLAASIHSSDNSKWGVSIGTVDTKYFDKTRVHSWLTEDGHVICIDCREGKTLESKMNYKSDSTTLILNNRDREFVSFSNTIKNNFSIEGAIMHSDEYGYTDCSVDEITSLVSTHCLYRNPYGALMAVAVTSVSVTDHHHYATVSVEMVEETQ